MQKKQKTLCQRRNSYRYRNNPIFLRNGYACAGEYQFPIVRRQEFNSIPKSFVYITDAKAGREQASWNKGVHCFVDDNKIDDLFLSSCFHLYCYTPALNFLYRVW